MSVHDDGLLFVYGECGPDVTEEEFNGIFQIAFLNSHSV